MININDFLKEIKKYKNILILTHDNPDPDGLVSAYLLQIILDKYGIRSDISFGGKVSRMENIYLVQEMKLDLKPLDQCILVDYDGYALVDTQKASQNHSLPSDIYPDITIDHHGMRSNKKGFCYIDETSGTASIILINICEQLDIQITEEIATAYCYSLIAETLDFRRDHTKRDAEYYKKYIIHADLKKLARIQYAPKPIGLFRSLKNALDFGKEVKPVYTVYIGEVDLVDYIPEIADIILTIKEIEVVLIVGEFENSYYMSSRSSNSDIDLSSIMEKISLKYGGSGGGHRQMAAGKFKKDVYREVLDDFYGSISKYL